MSFVNIADTDYDPKYHMGVTYEDAMDTIHAISNTGEVCVLALRNSVCILAARAHDRSTREASTSSAWARANNKCAQIRAEKWG